MLHHNLIHKEGHMRLHPVGMRICGYIWIRSGSYASAERAMQLYMQCVVAMCLQGYTGSHTTLYTENT